MTRDELHSAKSQISELLDRNRIAHAQHILAETLPHFPDDENLLYFAGFLSLRCDDLDAARTHTERLLQINPASYQGRTLMADIHEEREEFAQSEEFLLSIFADYPEDASTIAQYAMLMLRTMHVDKAGNLAEEALRLEPDNGLAMQVATFASIVRGDRRERDERLGDMMRKYPEMQATAGTLAQVLHRDGRYKEALQVTQEMLRLQPNNQQLVEAVMNQRQLSHWSLIPLRPFMRYGWAASIAVWFAAVILFRVLPDTPATSTLLAFLLLFVVYSWVWPWCLGKILKR